jgi:hypothetical protein
LSFFVVFDTCTHAAYYGDVHQVLALPEGAVIRYEYKRRLFQRDTARAIDALVQTPARLPTPVLLMYGEKMGFTQGDKDPETMLSRNDSVFIPTRSAWLVAVAVDPQATPLEDVFYLHLQLRGFPNPDLPEIGTMINASLHQLPLSSCLQARRPNGRCETPYNVLGRISLTWSS